MLAGSIRAGRDKHCGPTQGLGVIVRRDWGLRPERLGEDLRGAIFVDLSFVVLGHGGTRHRRVVYWGRGTLPLNDEAREESGEEGAVETGGEYTAA